MHVEPTGYCDYEIYSSCLCCRERKERQRIPSFGEKMNAMRKNPVATNTMIAPGAKL